METKVDYEAVKTETPAEAVPAGMAAKEEEEKAPADWHRILRIVVLAWAVWTVCYGISVISGSKHGFQVASHTSITIYNSWGLMVCRNVYGIVVAAEGFLLLGVWTRLRGLRKDGPGWLTAFLVLSFFVYLVYRVFLSMGHSEVEALDNIAWTNLACTAAMIAGSWVYRERTKNLYVR